MASTSADSSSRPLKRARAELQSPPPDPLPEPAIRDARFYNDSGDCVLRVEDTLFRISRSILTRDSPVLADMFAFPQAGLPGEGLSDDLPIRFEGDKAADFCSLFKYMHAPALETQVNAIPVSDLSDILAVANLAHKYEMAGWQQWAVLVLKHFLMQHSRALSSTNFTSIYQFCCKASDDDLRKVTTDIWVEKIRNGHLPIGDALDAAEAHQARAFLAQLYTLQLARLPTTSLNVFRPMNLGLDGVASIHKQRILAGYWSLSACWAGFRRRKPALARASAVCQRSASYRHTDCEATFAAEWEKAVVNAEARFELHQIRQRVENVAVNIADARSRRMTANMGNEVNCLPSLFPLQTLLAAPMSLEGYFFASDDTGIPPA
ncbi:hypothetical protein C8R43DRAFT_1123487 [Mycena crocata]|nr:hypothetical protein C8R43DRAFT_1123487 [Mycena crocata]